jgi:hypothetical protein
VHADADPDDPLECVLTLGIALRSEENDGSMAFGQRVLDAVVWILSTQPNSGLTMTIEDARLPSAELAEALRTIGATARAGLIEEAALLAKSEARTDDAWADLDDRWWRQDPGDTATSTAMWSYVQTHPQDFFSN